MVMEFKVPDGVVAGDTVKARGLFLLPVGLELKGLRVSTLRSLVRKHGQETSTSQETNPSVRGQRSA